MVPNNIRRSIPASKIQRADLGAIVICAVMLMMTAGLCCWIRPAADDFYYATFGDEGWLGYLKTHWIHYRTQTGRVFVHLVLCPLLGLDMWPFRVFNVLLIGGYAFLAARLCAETPAQIWRARAAALCVFWLVGIETLADGVLWGAGSLNYLFPVTLVLLYGVLLQRFLEGRGGCWLGIPAFLCASTVEMTGILPLFVFGYLCLTQWERARARGWRTLFLGLCTLAGYLFLYTSQGVSVRLDHNSNELSLWETMLFNYAMIDRRAVGPEGVWANVALALASSGGVLFQKKHRGFGALMLAAAGAVVLTGTGIVYDGVAVALIAMGAFLLLAGFAVWKFRCGERQIPLWMLCTTISLGVCLVSPVMGSRLILPTGLFLTVYFVRNLMQMRLPTLRELGLTVALMAVACSLVFGYTVRYAQNARVVDENTRLTRTHGTEPVLTLTCIPDEAYCKEIVPTNRNFGIFYLNHYGLKDVTIRWQDPTEAAITYDGTVLEERALLRNGQYYLPIRTAATILGAEVRWEVANAVVELGDVTYCFHQGNRVANLGHGITRSVKIADPVRNIDGRIHISVRDFEALFGVELSVVPGQPEA